MDHKTSHDLTFLKLLTRRFTMKPEDIKDEEVEHPTKKRIKLKYS
jgi:hypothetical protein